MLHDPSHKTAPPVADEIKLYGVKNIKPQRVTNF